MMSKLILLLSLVTLFSVNAISVAKQTNSPTPSVYHFSITNSALLTTNVEIRQSDVLAEFDTSVESPIIRGSGWDISGNWFAWYTDELGGRENEVNDIFAFDLQTQQLSHFASSSISQLDWSPNPNDNYLLSNYALINPDDGSLIAYNPDNIKANWFLRDAVLYILDENTLSIIKPAENQKISIDNIRIENLCNNERIPHLLHSNLLIYTSPNGQLNIRDTSLDTEQVFDLALNLDFVDWSNDGKFALVYAKQDCADELTNLYLYDAQNLHLTFLSDKVQNPYPFFDQTSWSPTNQMAWIIKDDGLYLFETANGKLVKIDDGSLFQNR